MKSRIVLLLFLTILLFVLVNRNNRDLRSFVLNIVNPLKSNYRNISEEIKSKGQSYLFQKEMIEKLGKENRVLRKYLLDQTHYLRQISQLYKKLPTLQKLPYKSIALVDTISYVKLNKFDEILLTPPKKATLREGKTYGLIQDEVVAGTARLEGGLLYGYLIANPKCRFDVFIGKERHPGIAEGVDKNLMVVKFIPKWAEIREGDRVETSGLDGIFFSNIPVGIVQKVLVEGSYKTAYITTYADTMHPDIFFLITDASPYLVSSYDQNRSFPGIDYPYAHLTPKKREENLSSVPRMLQTRELQVDPAEFEIPMEEAETVQKTKPKTTKNRTNQNRKKTKAPGKPISRPTQKTPVKEKDSQKGKEPKENEHPSPFDILKSGLF